MTTTAKIFRSEYPFHLERGGVLPILEVAYQTFGELNAAKDNVVWVFHALTANADPTDWWAELLQNGTISPKTHFIICANILGSPYGSSSPVSINPATEKPYYADFPRVTISDMVKAHQLLRDHLGIEKITIGLGGSMGGFQTFEWAAQEPDAFEQLILVASAPKESPWRIAIHATQRMAIESDPTWKDPDVNAGEKGVAASRAIGMLSYRNALIFEKTQGEEVEKVDNFKADSYMQYQGKKLAGRGFNGYLLWNLTKALDSHDIGRERGGLSKILNSLKMPILQIAITSDILFPIEEQQQVASQLPNVSYQEIESIYGHDGFLTETQKIDQLIAEFLQ